MLSTMQGTLTFMGRRVASTGVAIYATRMPFGSSTGVAIYATRMPFGSSSRKKMLIERGFISLLS